MSDVEPQYHPAGFDQELRAALEEVRAGRWRAMGDLLATTDSWELRTARSQVLAAAAAQGDAVEAWGREVLDHNWLMMWARVLVQRAINAHRAKERHAAALADKARAACRAATRYWPADPVPWVAQLALAQVDDVQLHWRRPEHRLPSAEPLLPHGPWGLLAEVCQRHPDNREGWHRMLQALTAYGEDVTDFGRWVASRAPQGSPLAVLPLYVYAQVCWRRQRAGAGTAMYWTTDPVSYYTSHARTWWFNHADRATWSPLDLNYLAQAMHSGGFTEGTAPVFEAIGECATPLPWRYVAADPHRWQEEFLRARRRHLRTPDPPDPPDPPRRPRQAAHRR
ncbi:hypothetical protein [Streptomyces sp. NPDC058371]|uniref:hypothetical protein n=1 Tax=Streptomyces sp. NPDC058371 TaxID=3346463 RepID=UPI0036601F0F